MKLRTKFQDDDFELGEVADVDIATMPDGRIKAQSRAMRGGLHTFFYKTKAEFDADWEDAPEEPKEYWFIDEEGDISSFDYVGDKTDEKIQEIGNYFETEEQAKKAVERLRAWKRLREKGFRFDGWEDLQAEMSREDRMLFNRDVINTDNVIGFRMDDYHDCIKDLNICFGGEE